MAQTKKKNRKSKKTTSGGDPEAPTETEWESMAIYKKFIVTENASDEEENVDHPFEVGDYVSILPSNLPEGYGVEDGPAPPIEAMWFGLIKDIRMRYKNREPEVWSRIQWFYSETDIGNIVQIDTTHLGDNERLLSSHCDFVHSSTLNDTIPIKRYLFDPTYPPSPKQFTASSSSFVDAGNAALRQLFHQKEIRAANSQVKIGSMYPDIYYRYNLDIESKCIFPKVSQFNCFSPTSNSSRSRSFSPSKFKRRPVSSTKSSNIRFKSKQNQDSCFFESSYSPPDSGRARNIGRQVAAFVREAHNILEDGITQILEFSGSQPSITEPKNPPQTGGATRIAQSRRMRTRTNSESESPSSEAIDVQVSTTAEQLASKMKEAIVLEDTLAMHVCPRAHCTAPRGRAWHRLCLIQKQALTEEVVEGGSGTDAEYSTENDESLQYLESWISPDTRRRRRIQRPISSPSFNHIIARWKAMHPSRQQEVERMLQLLCTVPPGYEQMSNMSGEGKYQFPVLDANAGITSTTQPLAEGKPAARGKRKARPSEQEEFEVSKVLLLSEGPSTRGKRSTSRLKANEDVAMNVDPDKGSKSTKKQRRSVRVSEADKLSNPGGASKTDDEDQIPRIMFSLLSLLAPELVCLASQPMVRGGVPPISSLPSRSPNSFPFYGTSPIFSSTSPFGQALQTTITGNISQVTRARIMVFKALDKMSLQKPSPVSGMDVDITDKEPLIVQDEWADYIVELEGREWLFELSDGASTSKPREKLRSALSRDKIQNMVLTRTHNLLRHWQARRRTAMLCPSCKIDI